MNTIGVASRDAMLKSIEITREERRRPEDGHSRLGWLAYCLDTEGNTFGVMEADERAG